MALPSILTPSFTGAPWSVAKNGDGVAATGKIRNYPAWFDKTAEECEAEDIAHYGGHLVAESVPAHLQGVIAVAPDALNLCAMLLALNRDAPACLSCAVVPGSEHQPTCFVRAAGEILLRLAEQTEIAIAARQKADERGAAALTALADLMAEQDRRATIPQEELPF